MVSPHPRRSIVLTNLGRWMLSYAHSPLAWSILIFTLCGPVCQIGLFLWAQGDTELQFQAISFQPQVFVWLPLCAPFIPLLAGTAFREILDDLKYRTRHRNAFLAINIFALLVIFIFDLCSPNVMPWEIRLNALGENNLQQLRDFKPRSSIPDSVARTDANLNLFGTVMSEYRTRPETWSFFRAIYYAVLFVGWTLTFLLITSSIYSAYRCTRCESEALSSMQRNCVRLLGAIIPVLPFLVLRRVNHLNKVLLYGMDAMNIFDWFLGILMMVCMVMLLFSAHATAEKLQSALSVTSSLSAGILFIKPELAQEILFTGSDYQTIGALTGIPIVLLLFLWPWLLDAIDGEIGNQRDANVRR